MVKCVDMILHMQVGAYMVCVLLPLKHTLRVDGVLHSVMLHDERLIACLHKIFDVCIRQRAHTESCHHLPLRVLVVGSKVAVAVQTLPVACHLACVSIAEIPAIAGEEDVLRIHAEEEFCLVEQLVYVHSQRGVSQRLFAPLSVMVCIEVERETAFLGKAVVEVEE